MKNQDPLKKSGIAIIAGLVAYSLTLSFAPKWHQQGPQDGVTKGEASLKKESIPNVPKPPAPAPQPPILQSTTIPDQSTHSVPTANSNISPQTDQTTPNLEPGKKQKQSTTGKPLPELQSISVNFGTADDFATLPGIGPGLAARIVDYRSKYGAFAKIEDIGNVRGIGKKKLATIVPYLKI